MSDHSQDEVLAERIEYLCKAVDEIKELQRRQNGKVDRHGIILGVHSVIHSLIGAGVLVLLSKIQAITF